MELDDIKRGLRAEIKKRENEQYATFQCNVRQMCKDVLAKLEEQESEIAEKDKEIQRLEKLCENYRCDCDNLAIMTDKMRMDGRTLRLKMNYQKYKRCLAMANWCNDRYILDDCLYELGKIGFYKRWEKRWMELAEKFEDVK